MVKLCQQAGKLDSWGSGRLFMPLWAVLTPKGFLEFSVLWVGRAECTQHRAWESKREKTFLKISLSGSVAVALLQQ